MRTAICKQVIVFGLLLLCVGCIPVLAQPSSPGRTSAPPIVAPTSKFTTPIIATAKIGKVTELSPIIKSPQPFSFNYPLPSGETLALTGGLTDEARSILQSGKTGYFLLCFADPSDPSLPKTLKDVGIVPFQYGWILAEVPPSSLQPLETWSSDGLLVYGGPIPPKGKINKELAKAIQAAPNGTSEISVFLFNIPNGDVKKQIERLFDEVRWPQYMAKAMPAMGGRIQNRNIQKLAELMIILEIDTVGGMGIQ